MNEKVTWRTEENFVVNNVIAQINSRIGTHGGKLYSVVFGRAGRDSNKQSKFFRFQDLEDIKKICDEINIWIECDRHETSQKQYKNFQRA